MGTIRVQLPAALMPLAGDEAALDLGGEKVGDVLHSLSIRHAAVGRRILTRGGELRRHVNIFLDEEDIRHLQGLDTPVAGYQWLIIVPSVAGG